MKPNYIVSDIITKAENCFPYKNILSCEYMMRLRASYFGADEVGLLNQYRNYVIILNYLTEIDEYNSIHAKSYVKRIRAGEDDWRNCEAVVAEIIVYQHYIDEIKNGLVIKIDLQEAECDLIVHQKDGSLMYLEVLCIMPKLVLQEIGKVVAQSIKTHTQYALSSIRNKLIYKIEKGQISKNRENYAVIVLNDYRIQGEFHTISSLTGGYKVTIDKESNLVLNEGFDTAKNIFEDSRFDHLKGVIYFNCGDYSSRNLLLNPNFHSST